MELKTNVFLAVRTQLVQLIKKFRADLREVAQPGEAASTGPEDEWTLNPDTVVPGGAEAGDISQEGLARFRKEDLEGLCGAWRLDWWEVREHVLSPHVAEVSKLTKRLEMHRNREAQEARDEESVTDGDSFFGIKGRHNSEPEAGHRGEQLYGRSGYIPPWGCNMSGPNPHVP